jgi:hypothetical protein
MLEVLAMVTRKCDKWSVMAGWFSVDRLFYQSVMMWCECRAAGVQRER